MTPLYLNRTSELADSGVPQGTGVICKSTAWAVFFQSGFFCAKRRSSICIIQITGRVFQVETGSNLLMSGISSKTIIHPTMAMIASWQLLLPEHLSYSTSTQDCVRQSLL